MNKLNCKKCKHEWVPRSEVKPKVCPKCKSYDWEEKDERTY